MSGRLSAEQACAAYLADPRRVPPHELPWESCDPHALLEVLQRNKVPLLSLQQSAQTTRLWSAPSFQAALEAEARQLASLRAEYAFTRETLASKGISDVLLKSVGLAPSFPYKSDNLDVLYRPDDVEQVRATLRALGYVELTNVEEPHKYLFRKFHAGQSVSAIHVHAHVGWMVSFLDEEVLWRRCRPSDDDSLVNVPAAEDALLTTLAHWFYEDKRLTLMDVCKAEHCVRQGVDWDEVYRIAGWRGWRDGLNVALLLNAYQGFTLYGSNTLTPRDVLERARAELPGWARAWSERKLGRGALAGQAGDDRAALEMPLRIPFAFSKALFYAKLVRDPSRGMARRVRDVALHTGYGTKLRLHIHSQRPLLVTFSGVDGSGKTTQVKALQSALETCHLRAQAVWSRGGSSAWLGGLTRLAKGQVGAAGTPGAGSAEEKVKNRLQRFRSRPARWGWSWLTALEMILLYARCVTWPLLRGRVVVCDRYVYDTLADWAAYSDAHAEGGLAGHAMRWFSPRPTQAYWLDVSPPTARARSADPMPADFLHAQTDAYARMATASGLRRLDGEETWEEISDRAVREVLSAYFAEYHTAINALFLRNPGQWK